MKNLLTGLGVMALVLIAAPVHPQYKVITRATPPPRAVLDRLGLVTAWHARLPIHGQQDGLFSVQVLPGATGTQLVLQTEYGLVALLDGETGDILWRTQVGLPGWVTQPVSANAGSIFVTRRNELHVLNRRNGFERVYTLDRTTRQLTFGMALDALPSAAPAADEDGVYFSFSNRLVAYAIPAYDLPPKKLEEAPAAETKAKEDAAGSDADKEEAPMRPEPAKPAPPREMPGTSNTLNPTESSLQPKFVWGYSVGTDVIQQPPLLAGLRIGVVTAGGDIMAFSKLDGKLREDYRITAQITRQAGRYGSQVYVAGDDTYVYAVNLENGLLLWRHLAPAPVTHRPAVTDRDVFITAGQHGLVRLEREVGREIWRNRQIERFLAVNQRFVYATDRLGNFYVLDGLRGTALARYDLQDWSMPVPNEVTDRIYLANRDGQVLCLRHRENVAPLAIKAFETMRRTPEKKFDLTKPAPEEKKAMPEEKKEEEKKEEKKKEEKDDKKEEKKDDEKKEDKSASLLRWLVPKAPPALWQARRDHGVFERPRPCLLGRRNELLL